MHKAQITQHQLRRAVLAQTTSDVSRETVQKPVKPRKVTKPKTLKSKDQKISKKVIHD
jgi:hypothetical protein